MRSLDMTMARYIIDGHTLPEWRASKQASQVVQALAQAIAEAIHAARWRHAGAPDAAVTEWCGFGTFHRLLIFQQFGNPMRIAKVSLHAPLASLASRPRHQTYSDRRKSTRACLSVADRALKLLITPFASEAGMVVAPEGL